MEIVVERTPAGFEPGFVIMQDFIVLLLMLIASWENEILIPLNSPQEHEKLSSFRSSYDMPDFRFLNLTFDPILRVALRRMPCSCKCNNATRKLFFEDSVAIFFSPFLRFSQHSSISSYGQPALYDSSLSISAGL